MLAAPAAARAQGEAELRVLAKVRHAPAVCISVRNRPAVVMRKRWPQVDPTDGLPSSVSEVDGEVPGPFFKPPEAGRQRIPERPDERGRAPHQVGAFGRPKLHEEIGSTYRLNRRAAGKRATDEGALDGEQRPRVTSTAASSRRNQDQVRQLSAVASSRISRRAVAG